MVDITITDVNEPPDVTGDGDAAPTFNENDGNIATRLRAYVASDPEDKDFDSDFWSVAGADRE